jgi:hypothetical protein
MLVICRENIGVLCAIGKDGNDNMFPIAVTVAEAETRES